MPYPSASRGNRISTEARRLLLDRFLSDRAAAAVNATAAEPGEGVRATTDTGNKISISNDALRVAAPADAWQTTGIVYGPYTRAAGLALAIKMQDNDVQASVSGAHLALGVWPSASPATPLTGGYVVAVENAGTAAGKLLINHGSGAAASTFTSIKQLELYLVALMRETGAALYITSQSGGRNIGVATYPNMRPIAIVQAGSDADLYAGAWFKWAGVVAAVSAGQSQYSAWYGTAHSADVLTGSGSIDGVTADIGGNWTLRGGAITLDGNGAYSGNDGSVATLPGAAGHGLTKITIKSGSSPGLAGLMFRYLDPDNNWLLYGSGSLVALRKRIAGVSTVVATTGATTFTPNATHTLQVVDDGSKMHCFLDDAEIPGSGGFTDSALASEIGVGIYVANVSTTRIADFESHARAIAIPDVALLGAPFERQGSTSVATEDFTGDAGDLDGKTTATGGLTWRKDLTGVVALTGAGTALYTVASNATAYYTFPWANPTFADLQVGMTPPGAGYGNGEDGLAGVLFWQDANNWLIGRVYLTDAQVGNSEYEIVNCTSGTSSVIRRAAMATTIAHGVPVTVRMSFDGDRFCLWHGGTEPVIAWSLTNENKPQIAINRVGIYADTDNTGTAFDDFVART